jgi:hypothetical protein
MNKQKELIQSIQDVLSEFEKIPLDGDIRRKVKAIIPAYSQLSELGKSIIPGGLKKSARERILIYFKTYPREIITHEELYVIAGISEWARRVRELRVEFGWKIMSGMTLREMKEENDFETENFNAVITKQIGPDEYILIDEEQDRDAAYRWNIANEIRKSKISMKHKILEYFRRNIGSQISGEELRYVAQGSEWARRVRELRTEEGWPISTKMSGNPQLPTGIYVLEKDRQSPKQDRNISESIRREVLRRDEYTCRECGWNHTLWNSSDPRFLEIHHIIPHVRGGESTQDNLETLCNVCHDVIHAEE